MNRGGWIRWTVKLAVLAIVLALIYWAGVESGKRKLHRKVVAAWNRLFTPAEKPAGSNITVMNQYTPVDPFLSVPAESVQDPFAEDVRRIGTPRDE